MTMYTLKDITRPSGGFAMLAVDQREAMRLMLPQQVRRCRSLTSI